MTDVIEPNRGQTISMTGRAFFARCIDCRRLVLANAFSWAADFAGDGSGEAAYRPRCTSCAKARRTHR